MIAMGMITTATCAANISNDAVFNCGKKHAKQMKNILSIAKQAQYSFTVSRALFLSNFAAFET
jgi:hypothetical protein